MHIIASLLSLLVLTLIDIVPSFVNFTALPNKLDTTGVILSFKLEGYIDVSFKFANLLSGVNHYIR